MKSEQLIQSLIEQTKQIVAQVELLKEKEELLLKWKPSQNQWNILECLEHLNLYGDVYFPEIRNAILKSNSKRDENFKSGWLGNYFAESMLPKAKLNKMKTFKNKNPIETNLDIYTIDRFLNQQWQLIDLLNDALHVSLNKVKVKTSISQLIQLKLGDTFRFIINHNIRHLKQIEGIEKQYLNLKSTNG
jgi:hypothetical protein